ncbi:MAG TPA: NADH-quinone oxidoreductase subunit NuoF [Dissulfurispiraceae bacterium]|nr:NADH-quinone oxidoreductase subunit NuoF [Dissulfurispiraceae bacterium]
MNLEDLISITKTEKEKASQFKHSILICVAAGCVSCQSLQVKDALVKEVKSRGLESEIQVKGVGCLGLCTVAPLMVIEPSGVMYKAVTPEDAKDVIDSIGKAPVKRLECDGQSSFFKRQEKIVLENCGVIDPERIEDYIAAGGYQALYKALQDASPNKIIDEITKSGLRGRGGGGFPTGIKWQAVAKADNAIKYVVCNADEGDPGAFMDRSVLESDPHRVIEGMLLSGYAVGAQIAYVYIRAEYPLAIKRLKIALQQAERNGLLGDNIFDTPFSFSIKIRLGAGAFVCGEETALLASIEGGRGTPRPRPPFPAESGLWGYPTLINNVETFANVPPIIAKGGAWFAGIGTEKSKGTKVFALAGRINNTGLIEVPMGTKLRDIVFDIGGGIPGGKKYKAVQTGGPSGGCIPEQHLDMSVDYESLAAVGSIMGSGGMIVMDETSCMVDVAKFFIEFTMSESCGKCIPCRVGTAQIYSILCRITDGSGEISDIEKLEELCDVVKHASLCGLGMTAPNPVMSTLKYFRNEYLEHINQKTCPAGVCAMKKAKEVKHA